MLDEHLQHIAAPCAAAVQVSTHDANDLSNKYRERHMTTPHDADQAGRSG